ncbi:hypothetical protein HanPI659440_Chr17g0666431 [Helianthus annuus]|nr:hypothetical protein HanPI659440_Chr17g0666431 [Helianthus annuus]
MARCWKKLSVQFQQRTENALLISSKLLHVNRLLARLPASQMANIRPCFDNVFAEVAIAFNKIANGIKIQSVENQSHLMSLLPH